MAKAARIIQRRKEAIKRLDRLMSDPEHVIVIHYSCESFYDRPDGTSPRITSIAVTNLESAQTISFSIHQVAEREGYAVAEIEQHYDRLERLMLDDFYEHVRTHTDFMWLHWNMRDINYGFQAIAHRYKVLKGQPVDIHESKMFDLSRLIQAIYGRNYISHPRLQKLVERNEISDKDFLSGADEAIAFENRQYVSLHFSTLRKVGIIATIAQRADEDSLKTDTTWRDRYGIYPRAISEWLNQHWLIQLIAAIFAIIGFVAALIQIWEWAR